METFDYVIVGAGSAGCVLAARLSEDPKLSICVLEAGPSDWHPYIHIPAGFIKTFYDKNVNWLYSQEPGPYTAGRRIVAPRGKTLGGSSSINGMVFNRGQALDYDTWAQLGNRNWGYADVLPYFKRLENRVGDSDSDYRGTDGPLTVTDINWKHPLCEAFIDGAVSIGIPRNPDYNASTQEGVSYSQRTIARGRRVSAAGAFLKPAMKRSNLTVRTGAHATSLILEGKRCVGVRYNKGGANGSAHEVRAGKEVILAGGTYNSPQLLQLSGIGPADVLMPLGIEVKHELPGVGIGLQDHYAPRSTARVKNMRTINEQVRGVSLLGEIAKWFFAGTGALAQTPTMVYCFWHSGESPDRSDLQLTFTPASYKEGEQGKLEDEPGMTVAGWQQRPESRGYVKLRSADPFAPPIIQTNYLAEEIDRRTVIAGMRLSRKLLRTDPLKPYYEREDWPGPDVNTDDEFLHAATTRAQTTFHPACTCIMGPASNRMNVVDDELRVHGLQGLRVVDASVMPRMISANLNAATLMIGEKAADLIRGKAAPEPIVLAR
ncbi:oxygen-dependent choline dehydrogenase [Variibacter gotjawalensis]|uniref:Oxygen-dependent choline dehydrogenase n=1 Tax=Variibacter gotjawalensis TaxID=1333996 RepID=A0A0S3PNT5_9BRAD|nr:GMC family oxidoreductase N-terminal domain-containing protein [Variibacter gotjawalensis]NIK47820.1 choline dehydrogenase [Variibacter gotjawalensis]RZS49707.1 choline dehydrogenase [Variibacter gotjawalensis]BAT57536.1 oxygen-dependent choline dehydrogenase [Variibacter gotjawalensis]